MKKVRAVYSKEFKVSTIRMMESKGMSAKELEESLGVPAHTIRQLV
jgi:transposase-like protein